MCIPPEKQGLQPILRRGGFRRQKSGFIGTEKGTSPTHKGYETGWTVADQLPKDQGTFEIRWANLLEFAARRMDWKLQIGCCSYCWSMSLAGQWVLCSRNPFLAMLLLWQSSDIQLSFFANSFYASTTFVLGANYFFSGRRCTGPIVCEDTAPLCLSLHQGPPDH